MNAVIIAGGFGTRMRPLTYDRPKHLLPVANRPFLEYQVSWLHENGVKCIVFATNYHADQIEAWFGDGSRFGVQMRYALENEPLGTAGAIRNAAACLDPGPVVAVNGDVLTDFDLGEMVAFHKERQSLATIALRAVDRPHAFGIVATEDDGRATEWREPSEEEKRRIAQGGGVADGQDYINAGVYLLENEVLDRIPLGRAVSVERETYPTLIGESAAVYGYPIEGYWLDIGSPHQYLRANAAVLGGHVRTEVPFSALGDHTEINAAATIDAASSIGPGVHVEAGAIVLESIVLRGCTIGSGARLHGVILDEGVQVGADSVIEGRAVIAKDSVLGHGTRLLSEVEKS
jgi:NDP-sugar pyrophosphorylase family protein